MDKTNENMVMIHKVPDEIQQDLIEEALVAEGIEFNTIEPEPLQWGQATELYHISEIWVLQDDAERAREIIEDILRTKE